MLKSKAISNENGNYPILETERLIIRPLTYEQLLKYAQNDHSLEAELGLQKSARTISAELKEALEETLIPAVADPSKNYLYHTLWTAISKVDNKMIGDLCIIGEPNAAGEIEIGYGTYDAFQGQGLMTEMVSGMILWAKSQSLVKAIIAFTEKTNAASYRVLEKNGFKRTAETATTIHWKLELS